MLRRQTDMRRQAGMDGPTRSAQPLSTFPNPASPKPSNRLDGCRDTRPSLNTAVARTRRADRIGWFSRHGRQIASVALCKCSAVPRQLHAGASIAVRRRTARRHSPSAHSGPRRRPTDGADKAGPDAAGYSGQDSGMTGAAAHEFQADSPHIPKHVLLTAREGCLPTVAFTAHLSNVGLKHCLHSAQHCRLASQPIHWFPKSAPKRLELATFNDVVSSIFT